MGFLNSLIIWLIIIFGVYGVFKFAWWLLDILEIDE